VGFTSWVAVGEAAGRGAGAIAFSACTFQLAARLSRNSRNHCIEYANLPPQSIEQHNLIMEHTSANQIHTLCQPAANDTKTTIHYQNVKTA